MKSPSTYVCVYKVYAAPLHSNQICESREKMTLRGPSHTYLLFLILLGAIVLSAMFLFILAQHLIEIVAPPIVDKETADVCLGLVSDDLCYSFKVLAILPNSCAGEEEQVPCITRYVIVDTESFNRSRSMKFNK